MTQATPGQVQIRLTLQDAEVLSSRVSTESILSLLKRLRVSSPLLHYITIHVYASMTLPYFMYFIKRAL